MHIYRTSNGIIVDDQGLLFMAKETDWTLFINRQNLYQAIKQELVGQQPDATLQNAISGQLLAPVTSQEIWASGVTYTRSREARMEEAKDAGGGDFYDKVYHAKRPEIFFKSAGVRAVGPGQQVRIRKDSQWNVPEPELTLFICSSGTIEGYTIGNDMSSRDIEGANPLYLPQAKCYDGAAAIGPCLYVPAQPIDAETLIELSINRDGETLFADVVPISRMKRKHTELAHYLFLETAFPDGAYLMTGTGIVPPDDFTLLPGDEVVIDIEGIGRLTNTVAQ